MKDLETAERFIRANNTALTYEYAGLPVPPGITQARNELAGSLERQPADRAKTPPN